jgi:hypothetical protein
MKKAIMSNAPDPENRSKKKCVCGGHSKKAKKKFKPKWPNKKQQAFDHWYWSVVESKYI